MFYFVLLYYFNIMQLSVYKPSGQEIRRYGISLGMRDGRNRKKKIFCFFHASQCRVRKCHVSFMQ